MQESSNKSISFGQHFSQTLLYIYQHQEELDNIRELLNEQIQFNLKDLYVHVAGNSHTVNYKHILEFVKIQAVSLKSVQSLIRFYNQNFSLNLSFSQFSSIFLNRQNKLLTKMTIQRQSMGVLPNYILNYARKILGKQIQLHQKLIQFRDQYSSEAQKLIDKIAKQGLVISNQQLLQFFSEITNPKIIQEMQINTAIRYLKPIFKEQIQKEALMVVFTNKNCNLIQTYLKDKTNMLKRKNSKKHKQQKKEFIDPYIRPQFHDCLSRPKTTQIFSYREIKSIEKHLDRLGQTNKPEIHTKIIQYESLVQTNTQKALQTLKQILWLQKQIQYTRIDLSLCPDFYPVLFFDCFHKDKQNRIIPSAMYQYLKSFGIQIPLSQIYLLFKRYAWHTQGKMDFNSFCNMFDVCENAYSRIQKNRQIKSLADVDVQTKKNFLLLLATIIKNQKKILKIKNKLKTVKDLNLRDIFSSIDFDQDGYLSITDFRVVWMKYFKIQISKDLMQLLWFRMGYKKESQIIRYEQFIKELSPKSSSITKKTKKKPL